MCELLENGYGFVTWYDIQEGRGIDGWHGRGQEISVEVKSANVYHQSYYGKTSGYMVSDRGIKVDPVKVKAILEMQLPKDEE